MIVFLMEQLEGCELITPLILENYNVQSTAKITMKTLMRISKIIGCDVDLLFIDLDNITESYHQCPHCGTIFKFPPHKQS